jgi:hypothetical protein
MERRAERLNYFLAGQGGTITKQTVETVMQKYRIRDHRAEARCESEINAIALISFPPEV